MGTRAIHPRSRHAEQREMPRRDDGPVIVWEHCRLQFPFRMVGRHVNHGCIGGGVSGLLRRWKINIEAELCTSDMSEIRHGESRKDRG